MNIQSDKDLRQNNSLEKTEARCQTLFESANDAIGLLKNGVYFDCNKKTLEIFECSREEIIGQKPAALSPKFQPDETLSSESAEKRINDALNGKTQIFEWLHKKSDGTPFHTEISLSTAELPSGTYLLTIVRDITQRKQAEESLQKSEKRYQILVENIPGVTYLCANDDAWTMKVISHGIEKLSGHPTSDFIQNQVRSFLSIIHPEDRQRTKATVSKGINRKKSFTMEYRIICADGKFKWVFEKGQGIFDDTGQLLYLEGVILDITEHKQTQEVLERRTIELSNANQELLQHKNHLEDLVEERTERLQKSLERLTLLQNQLVASEKMAALGELVAGIAHEINTPIGVGITAASHLEMSTQTFSDIYNADKLTRQDFEKYLNDATESSKIIFSNLNRAAELIQGFKQVAVDQSSEEQRQFNMKEYLHEILSSLQPKFKNTPHEITVHCPDDISINSYPGALSQILTNLLMNSLKHGFEGIEGGNISIHVEMIGNKIKMIYKDSGNGISKENIKKLFDPFFTTKRGKGGSGLGMYIVFNLITKTLEGEINCYSNIGEGTTFELEFPCQLKALT